MGHLMARKRWLGGYVRTEANGSPAYMIERQMDGRRWHLSTHCKTERAALKALERFEADPHAFAARMEPSAAVTFTGDLIVQFQAWQLDVKGNSRRHARDVAKYLLTWLKDLGRVDLRHVKLRTIREALDKRPTCQQQRIASLKSFYAWLRKQRMVITSAEDPTLDLPVPQSSPEKHKRRKVIPLENVIAAAAHLDQRARDCLEVLMATAWHISELERFARSDESAIEPGAGDVLAVLVVRHKSKEMVRTSLKHEAHVDAARRLKEAGTVPRRLNDKVKAACRAAGVPEFTLGPMRHSVGTWAVQQWGELAARVSEFYHHRDPRTARRFYLDVVVPAAIPVGQLN